MISALSGWLKNPLLGLIAFGLGAGVTFVLGHTVTQAIIAPLCTMLAELGQDSCQLVFLSSQEAFMTLIRQSLVAGLVLASPWMFYQLARLLAPTLWREAHDKIPLFALASGVMAVSGVMLGLCYRAPITFAPAIEALGTMTDAVASTGLASNYARAATIMAGGYGVVLQLPVVVILINKSRRMHRARQAEESA